MTSNNFYDITLCKLQSPCKECTLKKLFNILGFHTKILYTLNFTFIKLQRLSDILFSVVHTPIHFIALTFHICPPETETHVHLVGFEVDDPNSVSAKKYNYRFRGWDLCSKQDLRLGSKRDDYVRVARPVGIVAIRHYLN